MTADLEVTVSSHVQSRAKSLEIQMNLLIIDFPTIGKRLLSQTQRKGSQVLRLVQWAIENRVLPMLSLNRSQISHSPLHYLTIVWLLHHPPFAVPDLLR